MQNIIQVASTDIKQHNGLYSLNDLHRASGGLNKHKPSLWMSNKQTIDLINEIQIAGIPAIQSKQRLGTFVCKELVISYGMWISPAFSLKVIRAFLAEQEARSNISTEQKQQIQAAVNARHHRTGEHWQTIYTSLHQFLQVSTYHEIAAVDFDKAMQFLNATPNTPAIRLPEKEAMFSDHQLSRFATVVYYCSWMAATLKAMSEPLKALGAHDQGVEAWTLWAESQSWLHECRDALIDVEQRMSSEYFIKRLLESIQKTGRYL